MDHLSERERESMFHVCACLYVFVFLNSASSKKKLLKLVTIVIAASEWIKGSFAFCLENVKKSKIKKIVTY